MDPGGVWPPPRVAPPLERPWADEAQTLPLAVPAPAPSRGGSGLRALLGRAVPAGWRGARLDPGRPGATALALVAAGAAVVAAVGVWSERPQVAPVGGLPAVSVLADPGSDQAASTGSGPTVSGPTGSASSGTAPAQPPGPLVVSVSGKVARPGLVEVPDGARVAEVLDAAGGALPGTDLAGLNLARRVTDGEQVAVGVPPAPGPEQGSSPPAGSGAPAAKVDLNTATLGQLDALPGVGPVTAQRILEWRTRSGRFARVEQLREIDGIGERRFAQLRELVTV